MFIFKRKGRPTLAFSIYESSRERRGAARDGARYVLGLGANRLILVLAGIACAAVSFLSFFVVWVGSAALQVLEVGNYSGNATFLGWCFMHLLFLAVFWLLAMPFWFGMYRLAIRMVDGDAVSAKTFFHYVASADAYGRALGISARLILCWLPAFFGYVVMQAFFAYDLIGYLLVLLFAMTLILSLLLAGALGGFVTIALTDDTISLERARRFSEKIIKDERMCDFGFHMGMAWRILLSLLPAGIPLMLHTLPMSMLSAVCYVRRLSVRDDL